MQQVVEFRELVEFVPSEGGGSEVVTLQFRSRLTNISGNASAIGAWGPWTNVERVTPEEADAEAASELKVPTDFEIALARTQNARYYGRLISDNFSAKLLMNDIYGQYTGVNKVDDVNSRLSHISEYLEKGALPMALYAVHSLPPNMYDDTFVTPVVMLEMANQIEQVLQMSPSEHLASGVI
jgi:hypothetical protein